MLRLLDCASLLAPEGRQVCRNVDTPNSKAPEGRQVYTRFSLYDWLFGDFSDECYLVAPHYPAAE